MSAQFSLTLHFLQAFSHGRGDNGQPEWPPSPLRVFQALVAAAARRWQGAQFQECAQPALKWLEEQAAPTIIAPPSHVGAPMRIAVPNNDLDIVATAWAGRREPKKQPNELKTMKTVCATRLIVGQDDSARVHFLFPIPEGHCPHLEVLTASARSITHLGWGIDMVVGDASIISEEAGQRLAGERWRPVPNPSANDRRVPVSGTLDALIQKHHAFLNRLGPDGFKPVPPLSSFRVVGYRRTTDPPRRPYVAFKLLHPEQDRLAWFPARNANCVAAMTRHATACAAKGEDWIDSYVHGGHGPKGEESKPRFSYLPLPTIERRGEGVHVVGGIRRVLLAELVESPESRLQWARQMLPGQFLTDENCQERKAMLAPLNNSDWVLRQYTGESDTWATVTPVILPGSDDGRLAKAEKLFYKALRHAGYSPDALAASPEFRNVSYWPGGDLSLSYRRPNYLRNGCWSVYHVRLHWRHRIRGPLAIGAGRHCGLGIFAATSATQ